MIQTALIDADGWVYGIGFSAEMDEVLRSPDYVVDLIDLRVAEIKEKLGCENMEFWLSGKGNFRYEVATTKPYKGNREAAPKPYYYDFIRNYLVAAYGASIVDGIEADDILAVRATEIGDTACIVSQDKDLRGTKLCWHYSVEVGRSPEFGPVFADEVGWIELKKNKIKGVGPKFFYSQMITGDQVDNIGGLPRKGPAAAFKLLDECKTEYSCFRSVCRLYREVIGDNWKEYFHEQYSLLHMLRSVDDYERILARYPQVQRTGWYVHLGGQQG